MVNVQRREDTLSILSAMRIPAVALLVGAPIVAVACMWDSDTLAEEASLAGDYIATIAGRFPRNPSLYFQMRRDRLIAKAIKTPGDYDDLAVACERLGDTQAALRWIDRKPASMAKEDRMAWYRYHANRGTFLIHAWLGKQRGIESGRAGVDELKKAIAINPNAHFGREQVQIELVEDLLSNAQGDKDSPDFHVPEPDEKPLNAARGFSGIVRLGSGWESPDVFRLLAVNLAGAKLGAVGQMAMLRADEIEANGHRGRLNKEEYFGFIEGLQARQLQDDTKEEFRRLRKEADGWQSRRTDFMLSRLKAGRHPDTDPTFWDGYRDSVPPEVKGAWVVNFLGMKLSPYVVAVIFAVPITLIVGLRYVLRWGMRWLKGRIERR